MSLDFVCSPKPLLEPRPGCPWADTMVLNPAIVKHPASPRLHMLFRASGPWPQMQYPGRPLPYPIFLGYAFSDDGGNSWSADFSRPALAPAIKDQPEDLFITSALGHRVINHANGCIEDPRLFWLDGKLYLATACRMFPPGPYWINDEPTQCAPGWILGDHAFGRAVRENLTVTVLWQVDLNQLASKNYDSAFKYVCNITDPQRGDNRDTMLFPERLVIDGRRRYVALHRPMTPGLYGVPDAPPLPSMYLAVADSLDGLAGPNAQHDYLAGPLFEWEHSRVGASFPPIRISEDEWLVAYHGKQDAIVGYTQSFMILRERRHGFPAIVHRCSDRLMYAKQPWELAGKFKTPCLFSCAGEVIGDRLVISYGAADTKVGIASVDLKELIDHVRKFDAIGRRSSSPKSASALTPA
jgi:beta-1,2-mannobiose phosphorylase / 1,2-beta-oligomannan phosphorylase